MNQHECDELLMPGYTFREGLVFIGRMRFAKAGEPINPVEWMPGGPLPKKEIVLQRVWPCCGSPHAFHLSGCIHEGVDR